MKSTSSTGLHSQKMSIEGLKKKYTYVYIYIQIDLNRSLGHRFEHISGQIMIFHQPGFFLNKGISLPELPFGVRSCEVAIT